MNKFVKKAELFANVAIIVVAILLAAVLVQSYLLRRPTTQARPTVQIRAGTRLSLPDVDWNYNGKTLVMALSTKCHFCTESAPFYQRVAQERSRNLNLRLVAVFPQQSAESEEYLKGLGVAVDEVKQSELGQFGVSGTPTLILLNNHGIVENSWLGRLNDDKESEVLRLLN
jgi:hypothetical protein